MGLQIDERACVLSGVCASLAPERFTLDEDRAVVVQPDVAEDAPDAGAVADAVACCPTAAITVVGLPTAAPRRTA
ncbi:hypothetical protein GCM10009616_06840 [Microlunatus lacustris]